MPKDKFSKEKRSEIMSKIRKTNTKPEIITRKFLFNKGLRYRIHNKKLIGNPDIVLSKYKTVIFVNGCFWHAHENCKDFRIPKSNSSFWEKKIYSNVERDRRNIKKLEELGWKVIIIWECELEKDFESRLENLINQINQCNKPDNYLRNIGATLPINE